MSAIGGLLLTPQGWLRGTLVHDSGRIAAILGEPVGDDAWRDSAEPIVLPGFIDLHVHGGGGADTMQGGMAIDSIARTHARHGTTALLATTMTAPRSEIEAALRALAGACTERCDGAARVLGVHLEGPYISPDRLGAQPAFAAAPSADDVLALAALAPIRVVTLAPELPGAIEATAALVAAGIRVQIGHRKSVPQQCLFHQIPAIIILRVNIGKRGQIILAVPDNFFEQAFSLFVNGDFG